MILIVTVYCVQWLHAGWEKRKKEEIYIKIKTYCGGYTQQKKECHQQRKEDEDPLAGHVSKGSFTLQTKHGRVTVCAWNEKILNVLSWD